MVLYYLDKMKHRHTISFFPYALACNGERRYYHYNIWLKTWKAAYTLHAHIPYEVGWCRFPYVLHCHDVEADCLDNLTIFSMLTELLVDIYCVLVEMHLWQFNARNYGMCTVTCMTFDCRPVYSPATSTEFFIVTALL